MGTRDSTSAGRCFFVFKSEKGKGTTTTSKTLDLVILRIQSGQHHFADGLVFFRRDVLEAFEIAGVFKVYGDAGVHKYMLTYLCFVEKEKFR